jgi:acetolactate decarboxylase
MKNIISHLIIFVFSIALFSGNSFANPTPQNNTTQYQCPMKCEGEKTYDKSSSCPVCKMDLKKVAEKNTNKTKASSVKVVGAMMNVMHKGELFGTMDIDTIKNKTHLYGLGPVEYLKGEIMIVDGKAYKSTVAADGSISMEETFKVKAPFFVYANVDKWKEVPLPDSVQTIPQLESFLDQTTKNHARPFAFRLTADIDHCEIHIVNLPKGAEVHSPEDAHKNQKSFDVKNEKAELLGFFSTEHKGIFTHHDSFVHVHLLTADSKKMGHADNLMMKKGTVKLYIQE